MEGFVNSKCKHCNKALVPIGKARTNGKNHIDWHPRQYHKKCFKIMEEIRKLKQLFKTNNVND